MKRVWNYIVTMWQPATLFVIGGIIVALLFSYRIGSLVPGVSAPERVSRDSSLGLKVIADNPINAPYKVARLAVRFVHDSMAAERLVSGVTAGLSVVLFFLIVRHFCGRLAAWLATMMYATSTSLLMYGRLATPNVMLLMLLALVACGYRLRFSKHRLRSWLYTAVIFGLALYVPGMVYFIIAGIIWQYRAVRRDHEWPRPALMATCVAIVLLLITPLIIGFVRTPSLWHEYFGIPSTLPNVWDFIKSFLAVPFGAIFLAPENPLYRLGRQPTLDIFAALMVILGCYQLIKKYRLDRFVLLIAIFLIAAAFTALSGDYEQSFVLLPFIYICIAFGINMLLDEWRKVFPFNPLARGLAAVVMIVAVLVSVNFQAWRYFIAWPHNANTKTVFTKR